MQIKLVVVVVVVVVVVAATADEKVNKTGTDGNLSRLVLELVSVPGSVPRLVLESPTKGSVQTGAKSERGPSYSKRLAPILFLPLPSLLHPPPPRPPFPVMVIHGLRPA